MAHDVFAHHDGIVDQQAHTQAQRHQRDHVDGEAKHVHEQEGANQCNRQRQPRNHRGAPGVQEQEHDEHREYGALDQGLAHIRHRHADGAGAVADHFQPHARGQQFADVHHGSVQAIHHLDGVVALGFLHRQQQGALSVVEGEAFHLLRAIVHPRHLVEADGRTGPRLACRRSALAGHDDAAKVFGALHAGVDLHHAFLGQRADGAHGQVLVFVAHGRNHLLGRDAVGLQRLRVQVDVDFALGGAHQVHRAYTAHVFQAFFQHLLGPGRQLHSGRRCRIGVCTRLVIGQHGEGPHGAAGRVKAQNPGLFHLGAQVGAHGGHFLAHIFGGLAPIDVQLELDDHDRRALVAA